MGDTWDLEPSPSAGGSRDKKNHLWVYAYINTSWTNQAKKTSVNPAPSANMFHCDSY